MKKALIAIGLTALAVIGVGLVWFYLVPLHTARAAVELKLTDPGSAQFRNVRRADMFTVCGEVNAKNQMGGYTGFTAFRVFDFERLVGKRGFIVLSTSPASTMQVQFARDGSRILPQLERELAAIDTETVQRDCATAKP